MNQKRVNELNEGGVVDSAMMGSGVAVSNVNERIKLTYGVGYGVTYISEEDEGTLVRIHIPMKNNGGNDE